MKYLWRENNSLNVFILSINIYIWRGKISLPMVGSFGEEIFFLANIHYLGEKNQISEENNKGEEFCLQLARKQFLAKYFNLATNLIFHHKLKNGPFERKQRRGKTVSSLNDQRRKSCFQRGKFSSLKVQFVVVQ